MGSPFHGTRLVALGFGANAQQMVIGSQFLKELRAQIIQSKISYSHALSQIDDIIVPWESALLKEQEERSLIVDDMGHLTLLNSKKIFSFVLTQLRS